MPAVQRRTNSPRGGAGTKRPRPDGKPSFASSSSNWQTRREAGTQNHGPRAGRLVPEGMRIWHSHEPGLSRTLSDACFNLPCHESEEVGQSRSDAETVRDG